jgi:HAD superfamily hydrolase (TIGR01549 family)
MKLATRLFSKESLSVSAALCDWDGTLVRFRAEFFLESINRTLNRFGHSGIGSLKESVSIRHTIARFMQTPQEREEALEVFRQEFSKFPLSEHDLMPGAKETLSWLRAHGVPLGVVSNLDHELLIREVNRIGLKDYFSVVIGSTDGSHLKPDPYLIEEAGRRVNVRLDKRVLYIGDSESDVKAADGAGCTSVFIGSQRPKDVDPDITIDNLYQLISKILASQRTRER